VPIPQENYLIVEDSDLQYAIVELMKAHLPRWGKDERDWLVKVKVARGVNDVLNHEGLFTELKESGLRVLGIAIDADDRPTERWRSISNFCHKAMAQVPDDCPAEGLIVERIVGENGIVARFGAWIMPNNQSEGMLEDFCRELVPAGNEQLLTHAAASVSEAKRIGAPFNPRHTEKALLHSWLAWQDPPGERMGRAIAQRILRHDAESAKPFVAWFRNPYRL
jgi:hypothetical protein